MAGGTPPLPAPDVWTLPADWQAVDLLSDLHLSAALPRTFDAWVAHLRHTPADAVLLLGDVFEAWVGDDQRHAPFESRCVEVLREASARRPVAFMAGNRDFLLGAAMRQACGLGELRDPLVLDAWGRRLLLTHGDALCLSDKPYMAFRALARSADWQRGFLTLPLAERLRMAHQARSKSDTRRQQDQFDLALWADVDTGAAVALMRDAGCLEMIHGHTHRPGSNALADGLVRHVLSDWDLDLGDRAEVIRLTRAGLERRAPDHG